MSEYADFRQQVRDTLNDWPQEWPRDGANILIARAEHRSLDTEPAVEVSLRYCYTRLVRMRLPLLSWFDPTARSRVGGAGAYCSGAHQCDADAAVSIIQGEFGGGLPVQHNARGLLR